MKRTLIAAALLLLLPVAALGAAARSVGGQAEQVALTPTVLYGDPAAAQGLTVQLHSQYQDRLYWDTALRLEGGGSQTVCQFLPDGRSSPLPPDYGLTVYTGYNPEEGGLSAALDSLWARTAPGGQTSETVLVRDYLACYPIRWELSLPGLTLSDHEAGPSSVLGRALSEFLRIPVLGEEQLVLSVRRGAEGQATGWGYGPGQGDSFSLFTCTAVTADACYFTFSNRTAQGRQADTGQIPGGYGIYRLPYDGALTRQGRAEGVLADRLALAYPLDPAAEVLDLTLSPEGDRLLLHTREDGQYVLTVLSLPDMIPLQRLEVRALPEDAYFQVLQGEGCLAAQVGDQLTVLAGPAGADVRAAFTVPYPPALSGVVEQGLSVWSALAFDGARLAVADIVMLPRAGGNAFSSAPGCGFVLTVYDASGLRYCAQYASSLDGAVPANWDEDAPQPFSDCRYAIGLSWTAPPEGGA